MARIDDDDDLDLETADSDSAEEVEAEDEDEPKPKKIKAKVEESEDEEETPKPKKKVKASADDDEDAEEKRVVSKKPKSKGKEGKKMATKTVEKKHRSPKRTDKPYGDESLIGKSYNLANSKEGVPVKKLRAMAEKYKTGKTPAYWVITDLRRGSWQTAAGVWRWDVEEENGVLKISNLRLKRPKIAA